MHSEKQLGVGNNVLLFFTFEIQQKNIQVSQKKKIYKTVDKKGQEETKEKKKTVKMSLPLRAKTYNPIHPSATLVSFEMTACSV